MTDVHPVATADELDMPQNDSWTQPPAWRSAFQNGLFCTRQLRIAECSRCAPNGGYSRPGAN